MHGLVVDYIGMGKELAKALTTKAPGAGNDPEVDTTVLLARAQAEILSAAVMFAGVDRTKEQFNQIHDAQQILDSIEKRNEFAEQFMRCQGLFEFLWPDTALRPLEDVL